MSTWKKLSAALVVTRLLTFCASPETDDVPREQAQGDASAGSGATATLPEVGPDSSAEVRDSGAGGAQERDAGLNSDVFGSGGLGTDAGEGEGDACDYSVPGCDFTRVEGCCNQKACKHANGSDVFNTYPIESCEALLECVQSHPGCSTQADPLCFRNEDPAAPCLQQGYKASHEDPDGPFAWTRDLVSCVCGYDAH